MKILADIVSDKFQIQDVEHDGHCLYHCVQKITGASLNVKELRHWVADYIENNAQKYQHYLCTQGQCPEEELESVWASYLYGVRENEWGDYFVMDALANIFHIEIYVISTRTPCSEPLVVKPSSTEAKPRYSIYIGHLTDLNSDRDLHFVILNKKGLNENTYACS